MLSKSVLPKSKVSLRKLSESGHAAMLNRDWSLAIRTYRKILKIDPEDVSVWSNLGAAYLEILDVTRAKKALNKALTIEPNSITALGNVANLKKQTGNIKAAEKIYRSIVELQPDLARGWYELSLVKKFNVGDPDIGVMEELYEGSNSDTSAQIYLSFALGRAFEEIGEYDRAFSYIEYANMQKRNMIDFRVDQFESTIHECMEIFDKKIFEVAKKCGLSSRRPIFVLGMPRSGTTLVEQIITSHPDVSGGGELENLNQVIKDQFPGFPSALIGAACQDFEELGRRYLNSIRKIGKKSNRVTDKMPRNFLFIGMIALALPQAKIVHCLRSPMDTCLSCYSINFPRGQEFSYNQTDLGTFYRLYRNLMEHWHDVLPDRIFEISYEDIVSDPESNARALLEHCELTWDPGCLSFYENPRQILTASATQVREPVHQRSIQRWKRFENGLQPLRKALGEYAA